MSPFKPCEGFLVCGEVWAGVPSRNFCHGLSVVAEDGGRTVCHGAYRTGLLAEPIEVLPCESLAAGVAAARVAPRIGISGPRACLVYFGSKIQSFSDAREMEVQ